MTPLSRLTAICMALVCLPWMATSAQLSAQAELLTLDDLIARSPDIVVASVSSRRSEWEHYGSSRLIVTKVTLEIEQRLKGSAPRTLVVEVLGGTIGDETQRVSHVPEFRVNDRDVLFLNGRQRAASPIAGSDQGRFRVIVESGTGVARVLTAGFEPLQSAAHIGAMRTEAAGSLSSAVSLNDFVAQVRDRIRLLEGRR